MYFKKTILALLATGVCLAAATEDGTGVAVSETDRPEAKSSGTISEPLPDSRAGSIPEPFALGLGLLGFLLLLIRKRQP